MVRNENRPSRKRIVLGPWRYDMIMSAMSQIIPDKDLKLGSSTFVPYFWWTTSLTWVAKGNNRDERSSTLSRLKATSTYGRIQKDGIPLWKGFDGFGIWYSWDW